MVGHGMGEYNGCDRHGRAMAHFPLFFVPLLSFLFPRLGYSNSIFSSCLSDSIPLLASSTPFLLHLPPFLARCHYRWQLTLEVYFNIHRFGLSLQPTHNLTDTYFLARYSFNFHSRENTAQTRQTIILLTVSSGMPFPCHWE